MRPTSWPLAATALVLFASALSWAWLTLGLVLRSPNAVMSIGFVILFPVTFMSDIFVDPATMPGWLRRERRQPGQPPRHRHPGCFTSANE